MRLNKKSDRLGTDPLLPLLADLAIPSIVGMMLMALYNVVDSIYLGHYDQNALAALSLVFPVTMIMISFSIGTGVGSSSLISRLLGADHTHRANNAAEHAVLLALLSGFLVGIVGMLASGDIIRLFSSEPELVSMGGRYLRIVMIGSFAIFFPIVANNILRGEGNTFAPMITLVIGAILNIVLDPFLIFGLGPFPRLGVEGAAIATVFSRFVSGVFIALILFGDKNELSLALQDFRLDMRVIKEIYRVGLPAALMQMVASIMIAGMNLIVASYSTLALAVVGIYFRLQAFVFLPVFGLSQGYLPLVGYNFGHENPSRVKRTVFTGAFTGFAFTTAGFVLFQSIPRQLILLFNDNPQLVAIGETALRRTSLAFPLVGLGIIASATFQAIGRGLPSLLMSVFRQIIVLLPAMFFLGKMGGLDILWYAVPISDVLATTMAALWLWYSLRSALSTAMKPADQPEP